MIVLKAYRKVEKEGVSQHLFLGHILRCFRVFWAVVLLNIPIVDVLDDLPLSCQKAKSLDLSRQKRVDDEDYGLGTTVKVQLYLCLGPSKVEEHHANSVV